MTYSTAPWISQLTSSGRIYRVIDIPRWAGSSLGQLPYIHRILLENVLRKGDSDDARKILDTEIKAAEISFYPNRVLMHDTTCGPALADIAAMRSVLSELGHDPMKLNPTLPVDVSTDHSLPVEVYAVPDAPSRNMAIEYRRNQERYRFMKWAANTLKGFCVHPPGTGIMHTINLERLSSVVAHSEENNENWAYPDTLVGTDSHTPMINGIGVLGWGVGGLEAESVMFGMPVTLPVPDVVGVRLKGSLNDGTVATDMALTITERLRRTNLAGRFVEFFGPGVHALSAGDRAVIANMAPEYGANTGFFAIDEQTLLYLEMTGRSRAHVRLVADYAQRQGLWFDPGATPIYSDVVEIDLAAITMSLAGPKRPQDRLSPAETVAALATLRPADTSLRRDSSLPPDGAVAIAAITSCTNTSDPKLVIAAGLVARKARRLGLKAPSWVKTSLAPGSPRAMRYLERANLIKDLQSIGFDIVGYGCTTCIGNSGALTPQIATALETHGIAAVAVLSGNRNFPGRVHTDLKAAFLASPPLVVAYALAGDVNRNILSDPLGMSMTGEPVYLRDIWPSREDIEMALRLAIDPSDVAAAYDHAEASVQWQSLSAPISAEFPWDPASTYICRPPFVTADGRTRLGRYTAFPLIVLGDDITTDHISPVGCIPADSEAGVHLIALGEDASNLNVYAARRANWSVMLRGLFTNKNVVNLLNPSLPAGQTIHIPSGESLALWRAAERYNRDGHSTVIIAGARYGMGSSRDWAAKGVSLLGVRAVLATEFEQIHRTNLIGMGILPLRLPGHLHPAALRISTQDRIEIDAPEEDMRIRRPIRIAIRRSDRLTETLEAIAAVETSLEVETLRTGGIIPRILSRVIGTRTYTV